MTRPIIKWAGGKSAMISKILNIIGNTQYERYVDPFCGSLALPLELCPQKLLLNDINTPLIFTYQCIQDDLNDLIPLLEQFNSEELNNKDSYNTIRTQYNSYKKEEEYRLEIASQFLYLNKRCFNGLYRENSSGDFNVPFRNYNSSIYTKDIITGLKNWCVEREIEWCSQNYEEILDMCSPGDLVYLDPPYYPTKGKTGFTSYWKTGFTKKEHEKLAEKIQELHSKNIYFIMSNTPCEEIRELYPGFYQESYCISRSMRNGKGNNKNNDDYNEMLITNIRSNLVFED